MAEGEVNASGAFSYTVIDRIIFSGFLCLFYGYLSILRLKAIFSKRAFFSSSGEHILIGYSVRANVYVSSLLDYNEDNDTCFIQIDIFSPNYDPKFDPNRSNLEK